MINIVDIIQNSNILKCQWKPKPAGNPVGFFVTFQFLYIINELAEFIASKMMYQVE